jgi:hypothetical protein
MSDGGTAIREPTTPPAAMSRVGACHPGAFSSAESHLVPRIQVGVLTALPRLLDVPAAASLTRWHVR